MKTDAEFQRDTWTLKCLLQDALIRRLKDDASGESRMVAAELSSTVNFLKTNAAESPDATFNNVFPDEEE
ncbi:hypothetical protein CWM66_19355 [Kosakonia sp. H7A]|uniref:hypothetical protein n=1 Tax=Kosakonia sp. H7A TaxID=2054598 RepID=UPI000D1524CC|nr:hypothetical protein [Kosakonia sp. H7A]PTA89256.1 hypothetical protein CWM66_19355 [Kosakonia sp. H7A]